MTTEPGRMLGDRYQIGEVIGRGGMAEVHEGRDLRLGRRVAVKILRPDLARDPSFQARFRREAQSAAALNHPNIVAVYDTGEDTLMGEGQTAVIVPYIVMEYVDGMTLRQLLASGRRLLPERALEITAGVLSALDYAHRHGIVHRDIKPANVMLTRTGDVKVMDFGIARAMNDTNTATMTAAQSVMGTAQYLSPEQATVPQLVGLTSLDSVRLALSDANLQLGTIKEKASSQPTGYVLAQDPPEGTQVEAGSMIAISVSSGQVRVPAVIGVSVAQARSDLVQAGLDAQIVEQLDDTVPTGTVLAQSPLPGTAVDRGTLVTITVAIAPEPTAEVPIDPFPTESAPAPVPVPVPVPTETPAA